MKIVNFECPYTLKVLGGSYVVKVTFGDLLTKIMIKFWPNLQNKIDISSSDE